MQRNAKSLGSNASFVWTNSKLLHSKSRGSKRRIEQCGPRNRRAHRGKRLRLDESQGSGQEMRYKQVCIVSSDKTEYKKDESIQMLAASSRKR